MRVRVGGLFLLGGMLSSTWFFFSFFFSDSFRCGDAAAWGFLRLSSRRGVWTASVSTSSVFEELFTDNFAFPYTAHRTALLTSTGNLLGFVPSK